MIAIPVYVREKKNYELLKACLDSIHDGTSEDDIELFVNAWTVNDNVFAFRLNNSCKGANIRKVNSVAGAWNDAIELCYEDYQDGELCVIMNQDIEVGKHCINELSMNCETILAARTKKGEPDFALFAVNPEWIKETFGTLRPFDEGFEGAYFEDNDFKYQCKLKGIEIPTIELDFKHFGSSVVTLDLEAQKENEQRFRKNHIRYINKWGGIRNFETFKTPFNK